MGPYVALPYHPLSSLPPSEAQENPSANPHQSEGGNIGSVIGPPMFEALLSDLGAESLTLQGVDYAADAAGNANCGAAGGGDMADKVATIQAACPDTQIVLSGYSQGACVVHNAVSSQGASGISGAVVFGKSCFLPSFLVEEVLMIYL